MNYFSMKEKNTSWDLNIDLFFTEVSSNLVTVVFTALGLDKLKDTDKEIN